MKFIVSAILVAIVFLVGAYFYTSAGAEDSGGVPANNVSMVDGKQVIDIQVKGGYQPRISVAKAGLPTVLRFNTNGTFDCSSSVRIPSLGISKSLPQVGTTDIDVGSPQASTIQGMCSMGMYRFDIEFRS